MDRLTADIRKANAGCGSTEYDERLKVSGVGITPQYFLQHGVFPLLKVLGTSRAELIKAYRRKQARDAAKPTEEFPAVKNTLEAAQLSA